jgi:hypothetical protein
MAENRSRFISRLSHGNLAYFAGNIFVPHTDEEYERIIAPLTYSIPLLHLLKTLHDHLSFER